MHVYNYDTGRCALDDKRILLKWSKDTEGVENPTLEPMYLSVVPNEQSRHFHLPELFRLSTSEQSISLKELLPEIEWRLIGRVGEHYWVPGLQRKKNVVYFLVEKSRFRKSLELRDGSRVERCADEDNEALLKDPRHHNLANLTFLLTIRLPNSKRKHWSEKQRRIHSGDVKIDDLFPVDDKDLLPEWSQFTLLYFP